MFKNKALLFILAAVVLLLVVTGIFAGIHVNDNKKSFPADGFVLDSTVDIFAKEEVENQFYFSAGSKYASKYGGNIVFKDVNGKRVTLENNKFIHYYDGSLSALGKGVLMEAGGQLNSDQVIYYSISDGTVLLRNGSGYSMTTVDSEITLTDFVWKLSDTTYMVVSPKIDLYLTSESTPITFEDYIQIEYVSEGIVRLVHQNGAYQTISSEAYLTVGDDDVQLFLTGQFFMVDGEKGISLSSMVIGADDNVKVEENEDTIKMPTFNVVNGKDGAPGEDGTDGLVGEEGEEGDNGANGNNGSAGGAGAGGQMGSSGEEGENGSMGKEGDSGEWGYDGKAGEDATNADASGIVAVSQPTPPTVTIKTDTYEVTANGVNMDLAVQDPDSLLYGDLTYTLYDVATGAVVTTGNINRGAGSVNISSDSLDENSEYLLAVSGTYSADGSGDSSSLRDGTFFFKQFATKSLGIDLEKGQITEQSIMVDVTLEDDSDVSIFSLQYSTDGGQNWIDMPGAQNINVADLTDNKGTFVLQNLQADSTYSFKFTPNSVYLSDNTVVTPSDTISIKTLKELPYALDSSNNNKTYVPQLTPTLIPNQRDNKISVSIPELTDPDKGILKYRYELYETNTTQSLGDPVQTVEYASGQTVAFDVEAGKSYSAKVVVLFDDNEKIIELETQPGPTVALSDKAFPTVTFSEVTHDNDRITVTATIYDAENALLGNINSDYPLRVTMSSTYGDVLTSTYYSLTTIDATTKSFVISQDGLRSHNLGQEGVDYVISITGPVNTEEVAWSNLSTAQKDTMKDTYIGGGKYTTGQQAIVDVIYSDISSSMPTEAFALQFNTRKYTQAAAGANPENPAYIADENTDDDVLYTFGTINRMTFTLYDSHNQELGTTTVVDKAHSDVDHDSEFYEEGYSADGTNINSRTTANLVLTPSSFGVTSTSLSPSETYKVVLTSVQDYVGNELAFAKSTAVDVSIKESHSISPDPTNEITIREIRNADAPSEHKEELLDDDTKVGFRVVPSYGLGDVIQIKYYAYEVTAGQTDPDETSTHVLVNNSNVASYGTLVDTMTYTNFDATKAKEGKSYLASEHYPVIYFNSNTVMDNGTYVFERGKTYFFKYEITTHKDYAASCYGTDPTHSGEDEIYPYCIYKTTTDPNYRTEDENLVPFYRSRSYCAERSKPSIQAYPVSKGDGTITWAYAIYDPDNAIGAASADSKPYLHWVSYNVARYSASFAGEVLGGSTYTTTAMIEADKDFNGTVYYDITNKVLTDTQPASSSTYNIGNTGLGSTEVTTYKKGSDIQFNTYELDKMSDDHYYRMYFPYVLKGDTVNYITSDIYIYDAVNNWVNHGITASDIEVEDKGGGEIKLYIDSNNIEDVAALKVELSCSLGSVTYDPVMFTIGAGLHNNKKYAVCYLDSAVIPSQWQGENATITITPYFNTFASSLGELQTGGLSGADITIPTANGTLSGNKYAIYNMDAAANNTSYIYTDAGAGVVVRDLVTKSIFTLDSTGSYFTADPIGNSSALNLQYVDGEINNAETIRTAFAQSVNFDENGAYFGGGRTKVHFDVYKLTDGTAVQSAEFQLKEQLPKIRFSSSSVGVKSAILTFEANGDLDRYGDVYVELYRTFPDNTQKGCNLVLTEQDGKYIYSSTQNVDESTSTTGVVPIAHTTGDTNGTFEFMITGLEHSTEAEASNYYVRIYRLDGSSNKVYLYDMDYKMQGKQYNFTMANEVDITIVPSTITYNSYLDKSANFDYYINGAGMGFDLKYTITYGGTVVQSGTLPKIGTGDYAYYGNKADINTKQSLDLSPITGNLKLAGTYVITLTAIDLVDQEEIGTKTQNFVVPLWSAPVSRCTVVAGADNIRVTYNMNDIMKTIVNEDTSTTEGKYNISLWSEDESTQIGSTFECSAQADVVFDGLSPNTKYVVKVTAVVDGNNNHTEPYVDFVDTYTATTQAEVSCKVTGYKTDAGISMRLYDLSNFNAVTNIKYTIYGPSGNSIASGDSGVPIITDGTVTIDTTAPAATPGTYTINVQFYDAGDNLLGNVLNTQFIVN